MSIFVSGSSSASSSTAVPSSRASLIVSSRLDATIGASTINDSAIPMWRTESRRAASERVRSGISSPARAGRASPIPAPARTWGGIVHQTSAFGRSARQPMPAATSRHPATARVSGSPPRRADRTAAIGRAVTASAAAIGSMLHPAISNRTTKKTTAVRAAETRARAIRGRASSRDDGPASTPPSAGARGPSRNAAAMQAMAPGTTIGSCTRKIARQSKTSVSTPPSAGPVAVPKTDAATHRRRPWPGEPPSSRSNAATSPAAPPTACTARSASSVSRSSTRPQASDESPKTTRPTAPSRAALHRLATSTAAGSATARTTV